MALRIAIIGYGKMGKAIEQEAIARGHLISHKISKENKGDITSIHPKNTDLAIEFTEPNSAFENFSNLLKVGIPIVAGTTGWSGRMEEVKQLIIQYKGSFIFSPNFSPGVNILFKLNEILASMMNHFPGYDVSISERHHKHKKDAPGGTALMLAEQVIRNLGSKKRWAGADLQHRAPEEDEISMSWVRAGEIPGTHEVAYTSSIDEIKISHQALNRRGFALGAVIAAEWLHGKSGFYNFSDVFDQA